MIRVAFLIRSLDRGGTQRQLVNLVRTLDGDRFVAEVITFYSGGHFDKELEETGVRLVCLGKQGRWEVFSFLWRLIRELKRFQPDILHSFLVEPNLLAVLLKLRFRSLKVIWAIRASKMDLKRYDWFPRMNFRLQRWLSHFADLIISNSQAGRDSHVALGFAPKKFIVIHNGIDIEHFRPDPESRSRVRAEWGIAADTVLIGIVARLDPMKDHPTFLKAAAILSAAGCTHRFVCVGIEPQEYASSLRQPENDYGLGDRVVWAGPRDDMPAVYNALDIVCSSSAFGEGLPNAICEAMACGVRCVVTDVGDSALLVGDTGVVVPPNDPQALADGLTECLNRIAFGPRPNPRSRIEERFGIGQFKNQTESALMREAGFHTVGVSKS